MVSLLIHALLFAATVDGENGIELWNGTLAGWQSTSRLASRVDAEHLILDVQEPDSWILRDGLNWKPGNNDVFIITYRAEGFTEPKTSGEIFFHGDGGAFADAEYIHLPSLDTSGAWGELIVPVARYSRGGISAWTSKRIITALRMDFVDQAPGHIEVASCFLSDEIHAVKPCDVTTENSRYGIFLSTDSFQKVEGGYAREVTVPAGSYSVWWHIYDGTMGRKHLSGFKIEGGQYTPYTHSFLGEFSQNIWERAGTVSGGKLRFSFTQPPSIFFDALMLIEGDGELVEKLRFAPPAVISEMAPAPSASEPAKPQEAATPVVYTNPDPGASLESHVAMVNDVPQLFINDAPVYPMVGNGEGRDRQGTREAFQRAGFNIDAIWIDPVGSSQWWQGPGQYAFDDVDAKIASELVFNPSWYILPIIWAAPPPWWQEQNPDEIARFSDGTTWQYYKSTPSFASAKWRQDAAAALTAFVEHCESMPYGARVLGYWVIGGVSAEWQGWGSHGSHEAHHAMDYSAPEEAGFRAYLEAKYPGITLMNGPAIPTLEQRLESPLGVFRDPVQSQRAIDFDEYYSESLADCLLHCTAAVKNACGRRKITGVYFGYTFEYGNMAWCLQLAGHNALRKVLDSPDVDFLSAPHSYAVRRLGHPAGWMWPFRSIQLAGKLVWPDDDTRTYLANECDYGALVNREQSQAVIRRNFGKVLCARCPQGFLQISSGRELDDPVLASDIQAIRRAGEYAVTHKVARTAEIAVVVNEASRKYLVYDSSMQPSGETDYDYLRTGEVRGGPRMVNTVMGDLVSYQRDRIERIGAPVDYLLFSDILKRDLTYKLYLMLDCFTYTDAEREAVQAKLYNQGAMVVWCYAPGYLHEDSASVTNIEALTGIHLEPVTGNIPPKSALVDLSTRYITPAVKTTSFGVDYPISPLFAVQDPAAIPLAVYVANGAVSFAVKKVANAESLFFGGTKLPTDLLQSLAKAAGVHVYTDAQDPFEANDQFIMIHAAEGGRKEIRLRAPADIVDIFTNQVMARGVDRYTIDLPENHTGVYFTGGSEAYLAFVKKQ